MDATRSRHDASKTFLSAVFAVAAACVVLRAMGRQWWCACGGYVPWSWTVHSSHNSQHLIDPYFFTHVLHGVIFFGVLKALLPRLDAGLRFLLAVIIESAWEILENSPLIIERYRAATISLNYYGDSIANSICDILACVLGYWLASRIGWRWSILFFIAVELVLMVTIRDSLSLNVLMLVYPIEAIKQWQSAM
jgi:predicted MFS family arabinose efflux permease